MPDERKSFPLRISKQLYSELREWADQEMRSVNAQIEFLLRQSVSQRKQSRAGNTNPSDAKRSDDQ